MKAINLFVLMATLAGCSSENTTAIPAMPDATTRLTYDASVVGDTAKADAAATLQEPTPAFSIGPSPRFLLAIDEEGIRPNFVSNGETVPSAITLVLQNEDDRAAPTCELLLSPAFDRFASRDSEDVSTPFRAVVINLGAGTILHDTCEWDDDYLLRELEGKTIMLGFSPAPNGFGRFHLYSERSWPYDSEAASIVELAAAVALTMDETGVVNDTQFVVFDDSGLPRGLYFR